MFSIQVRLPQFSLQGLDALDLRRRLGLVDGSTISSLGQFSRQVKVNENFVRIHFSRTATNVFRDLKSVDWLVEGDVEGDVTKNGRNISWSESITDERLIELWVASKA